MDAFTLGLSVVCLAIGVYFFATSSQRAADYRRAGRTGWPTRQGFYRALGVLWLLIAALRLLDA